MESQLFTNQSVPDDARHDLKSALSEVLPIESVTVIHQRSYDVPPFIQIVLDAMNWVTPLRASAAFLLYHFHKFLKSYVERFGERAADATAKAVADRNQKINDLLNEKEAEPLRQVVIALTNAAKRSEGKTVLRIGFPFPEDYFGALYTIKQADQANISYLLSVFIVQAEEIEKQIKRATRKNGVFGSVELLLDEGGRFMARWKDEDHKQHEITVKLDA